MLARASSCVITLALAGACTDDAMPVENHDMVFGRGGAPSPTAAELFAKHDAMTTTDVVGVYETMGQASGLYDVPDMPGVVGIVRNNVTRRVEIRESKIVTGLRCELVYTNPDRPGKTLTVFVQQDAQWANDVYEILMSGGMGETDQDSFTECNLMLDAGTWALCTWMDAFPDGRYHLPAGASDCLGRDDGELVLIQRASNGVANVDAIGRKVAN